MSGISLSARVRDSLNIDILMSRATYIQFTCNSLTTHFVNFRHMKKYFILALVGSLVIL